MSSLGVAAIVLVLRLAEVGQRMCVGTWPGKRERNCEKETGEQPVHGWVRVTS
jgi:hypothetical protein